MADFAETQTPAASQGADQAPASSASDAPTSSASADEVARFTAMAETWWDPSGKFRPLHQINPPRTRFIRDNVVRHFALDAEAARPFAGLKVVDVGCGGGILSEAMARLGADVTGLDAGDKNVEVAKIHAEQSGLDITYRQGVPEDLAREGLTFDVVLNMEVIEHVTDPELFMAASAQLLAENGCMALSTINRNVKSLLLAKVGAEYVLRWLPRGTHDWRKFLKPSELAALVRPHGLEFTDIKGLVYNPLKDTWSLSARDLDVNYLAFVEKKAG